MPRRPAFTYKKTKDGWKVEVPSRLSASGKRERAFFSTRDKARDFAQGLEAKYLEHGAGASAITPSRAEAATIAEKILEPTGASLVEAARAYLEAWQARNASCKFGDAALLYLDSRATLRPSTLKSYEYTLTGAFAELADLILAEVPAQAVQAILDGKGSTAAAMHRRNLKAFWRWAAGAPRRWCKAELLEELEKDRSKKDGDIVALMPDEIRMLLKAAEKFSPAAACSFAVAIFGGVRQAELGKLTWGDVLADHIEIGMSVSKKSSRRLVPICKTLRAWLDAYRGDVEAADAITGSNWIEVSRAVRRSAGWDVSARLLKRPPEPTRGQWPANACRHTCASLLVAVGTPLETLTFQFGHSGGHDLLRKHYVARMTRTQALDAFSIGPRGRQIKIVAKDLGSRR